MRSGWIGSDHVSERPWHTAIPLIIAAAGRAGSTMLDDPTLKMISFCVAGFGIFACLPVFWTLPTAFLSGTAAAAGIAVVNSIGNLAGPFAMGWIKDHTGSYAGGLLQLAGFGIIAMGIVLSLRDDDALERAPGYPLRSSISEVRVARASRQRAPRSQTRNTVDPVVLRAARSACALAASLSG
jgi:MFS family permease